MKMNGNRETVLSTGAWNMAQGEDALSKSLQKQIASAQKALQELSADKDLSVEEKMKKRQELQQKINDLNQQLRQHQIDQRREKQQAQKEAAENRNNKNQQEREEQPRRGLSRAGMEAMVSADSAMKQAKTYESVSTRLKGEAGTLGSEISLDQWRGQNVEGKVNKLAEIEKRIEKAEASQVGTLTEAVEEMRKTEEKERKEKQAAGEQSSEKTEKSPGEQSLEKVEKSPREQLSEKVEKSPGEQRTEETKEQAAMKQFSETENILQKEEEKKAKDGRFVDIRL